MSIKEDDAGILGIGVVPIAYLLGDSLHYEKYTDTSKTEEHLSGGAVVTTAQPNRSVFERLFKSEIQKGNEVLCITISSKLSGIYHAARSAAATCGSPAVRVFDSGLTAGGLYLMIEEARRLIDSGLRMNELLRRLTGVRGRIKTYFSVGDMEPLRRSGRIGLVRMRVGTILNIKPILVCSGGRVIFDSMAHGAADRIKKLAAKVPSRAKEVIINYISDKRGASDLYNVLKSKYPHIKVRFARLGTVLGAHLGGQVIAVSFVAITETGGAEL